MMKTWFHSSLTVIWKTGLFFLIWAALVAPLFAPMGTTLKEWESTSPLWARLYSDSAGLLTMIVATWIMLRYIDHRPLSSIGFAAKGILPHLPLGIGLGIAWLSVSVLIPWLAGWVFLQPTVTISWRVLLFAGIAIFFNVITQQLLLCGYIFHCIQAKSNVIVATVLSALLFMLYHVGAFHGAWLPAVNVFCAGFLFCIAYRYAGNLWFPIAIHFAWNFLLGTVLGLVVSGQSHLSGGWNILNLDGPALFTGGTFGLEGGLIVTFTTITGIIVMLILVHQRHGSFRITQEASGVPSSRHEKT
ncbi:MAG: type II CAAX endopeptidase family protein [Ignavibacteria bacterium]|nr:type II CAAX endopeptidase family protein [Ignavibacteria bacterium]